MSKLRCYLKTEMSIRLHLLNEEESKTFNAWLDDPHYDLPDEMENIQLMQERLWELEKLEQDAYKLRCVRETMELFAETMNKTR